VLVDLGSGVNMTAAQATTILNGQGATDKSFAEYYNASSYGKYQVQGSVIGPYPFSMTTCDTTGMYKAIEPMITGTYNHLIYYFNQTNLCSFGGLGEEGSAMQPAKRTWMNGSLSCVVLMQEPGHNIGLMHANTMKCGTTSFDTNPVSDCTITEYGSGMSTMGGGCKQFNAYERWYMQWLSGCNGVRVPSSGTFNLMPLESNCSGGSGIQVLQVPFPATLTVSDPHPDATRTVFFELNGQPREVTIHDHSLRATVEVRTKADAARPGHVGAPIPGAISSVAVEVGQRVAKGERLLVLEAMKMQSTVYAPLDGKITQLLAAVGDKVEAKDLLVVIE